MRVMSSAGVGLIDLLEHPMCDRFEISGDRSTPLADACLSLRFVIAEQLGFASACRRRD
jgi:hypothetical protein